MQVASDTCTSATCFLHILRTLFGSDPWEVSSGWLVGGDWGDWGEMGGDWWELTIGQWEVGDGRWQMTGER